MPHFRKAVLLSVLVIGLLPLLPSRVEAITLDKSTYIVGDPMIAVDSGGPIVLYGLDVGGEPLGQVPNYAAGWDVNSLALLPPGRYSFLEFDVATHPDCSGYHLLYAVCKASDIFISEFTFTVATSLGRGGGGPSGALSLGKSQYAPGETVSVYCQAPTDWIHLYDITSGIDGAVASGGYIDYLPCKPGTVSFNSLSGHTYAVIEVINAQCTGQDYALCSANTFANVAGEVHFTVNQVQVSSSIVAAPSVTLVSPKAGDAFSYTGIINYSTLNAIKVNVSYSDKLAAWDGFSFVNPGDIKTIASDVAKSGPYSWSTKGLAPGNFYRIIIDAFGLNGFAGQAVSGLFAVDFTPPTFIIRVDPPVTRGSDVTISVDASENLKVPPTVTVTQARGNAVSVTTKGQGSHYEGVYAISKGYDGVATITVSGSDTAGNVGATILSGGTFAVGINPPPVPRIASPQTNAVVGIDTITITGTVRADTAAVVVVNGVDTYTASSSPSGAFTIPDIRLSKSMNRGLNTLSVAARDQGGLFSAAVPVQVKYNIAPTIAITLPTDKAIVTATTLLTVQARDENADPLTFTFQIIPAQGFDATVTATSTKNEWTTIGDSVPSTSFSWDSTEVEDGQYFLRVIADDGFTKSYAVPVAFNIHNTLPFFRFEDGRRTITNQSTITIVGRALAPNSVSPLPTIKTVEYSLDGGKKWKQAALSSGGDTPQALFSVTLASLAEGTHGMLWRVKDSRGFYGRASHLVIVDTVPPAAPIVNTPANNAFVTNVNDEDGTKNGLQISVSGTTESQSTVTLQTASPVKNLISNGASTSVTTRAGMDGDFFFHSVDVPRRGMNQFTVTAADDAGNVSPTTTVNVLYDNPPSVTLLAPKPFRGLTGKALVSWSIRDADDDAIQNVALSWRRGDGAFTRLPIDPALNSFIFDVSSLPEAADYRLRLEASDGMATGTDLVNFSVDRTPPALSSLVLDTAVLGKGGTLRAHGTAQDDLSGIEYVEYAVTTGDSPDYATALLTNGFLQREASYSLTYPTALDDAIYHIYVRAVDAAGNVSPALSRTVTVDTTPPRIGGFDVLAEGARFSPDAQGTIALYKGVSALFEVSLEADTETASLSVGTTTLPLTKEFVSGLWQTAIDVGTTGTTTLALSAKDRVHNAFVRKVIGTLAIATRPAALRATSTPSGILEFLRGITRYLFSLL